MKTLLDQSIEKSRAGVYQDTSENRRKHRVGQHYGDPKKPEEEGEEKKSKREQRMERLLSYKQNLHTIEEALKRGMVAEDKKEKAEALKASLEEKISKLESKLKIKKDEAPKTEPKKEEAKKPEKKQVMGPVTHGKDGVSVEEMAKDKKPEFVKRGVIDPSGDPDWEKKSDETDWDKVDLARMGQTIEYLGKIGQFEDGSDMYGIRYWSPNGKSHETVAHIKSDYLRNVQRAGFNVRESMRTAVDYISQEATPLTQKIAKMVLEGKTPSEIHDLVKEQKPDAPEKYINAYIKRGYVEAEAASIRMENEVNGISRPVYEKDESDPIPDAVKKLNQRSDEEAINEAIATFLGLEINPNNWKRVNHEDVDKIDSFWEKSYRSKGLSKTAVIDKLKKAYRGRQDEANKAKSDASMKEYYASEKGQARLKAFKEKRKKAYDEYKGAAETASTEIKNGLVGAGFQINKVEAYSDGSARIWLEGSGRYGSDVEIYYKEKWGDEEGRVYEVQTTAYGAVRPGSVEAKAISLQGALVSDEKLIDSVKEALEKVATADEQFERAQEMLNTEYDDLFGERKGSGRYWDDKLLSEALKALGGEEE